MCLCVDMTVFRIEKAYFHKQLLGSLAVDSLYIQQKANSTSYRIKPLQNE